MDGSHSPNLDSKSSKENPEIQASKKRKIAQKTVVTVKIEENEGKQKSEGPPSDCWSWRKYGQKPIKGSPYPRGYYRCSTSKGCSAKKQVERCKTNASMLIVTYTSTHNHPTTNPTKDPKEPQIQLTQQETEPETEQPALMINSESENNFHYSLSPFNSSHDIIMNQDENPFTENLENAYDTSSVSFDEEPLTYPHLMNFSTPEIKSEEYDFYDELEELPTSSSFTSFPRSNFFDERILVQLS